jgi:hypothetical protein
MDEWCVQGLPKYGVYRMNTLKNVGGKVRPEYMVAYIRDFSQKEQASQPERNPLHSD